MVSIQGYGDAQIGNAATIADVARSMGLGDRGALLGVMCAMGESSLRNIDYGDWETSGVRNPDGSPTTSIGLFQQQASWGSVAERMDPRYAAWAFFSRLRNVRDWATIDPTIAIHRVQINADPNHYAKYEAPARAVLAYITEARARGGRFMAAPTIEWIRDGVGFRPDAAASFRRAEASWGSIPCNSTYRDYGLQLSMWQAWTAWTEGRGPKPNHSRALYPDESMHCQGLALDTNLWTVRGFIDHMADHGWIRTAAWDPTEQHHFEYQWWRDNHRNDPAPAGTAEEDDMFDDNDRAILKELRSNRQAAPINFRSTTGGVSYTMIPGIQIIRHENVIAAALTLQFVTGGSWPKFEDDQNPGGDRASQKQREAAGERQLRDDEILNLLGKFGFAWTAKNIARLPEAGKVRYADWIMQLRGEDISK